MFQLLCYHTNEGIFIYFRTFERRYGYLRSYLRNFYSKAKIELFIASWSSYTVYFAAIHCPFGGCRTVLVARLPRFAVEERLACPNPIVSNRSIFFGF